MLSTVHSEMTLCYKKVTVKGYHVFNNWLWKDIMLSTKNNVRVVAYRLTEAKSALCAFEQICTMDGASSRRYSSRNPQHFAFFIWVAWVCGPRLYFSQSLLFCLPLSFSKWANRANMTNHHSLCVQLRLPKVGVRGKASQRSSPWQRLRGNRLTGREPRPRKPLTSSSILRQRQ